MEPFWRLFIYFVTMNLNECYKLLNYRDKRFLFYCCFLVILVFVNDVYFLWEEQIMRLLFKKEENRKLMTAFAFWVLTHSSLPHQSWITIKRGESTIIIIFFFFYYRLLSTFCLGKPSHTNVVLIIDLFFCNRASISCEENNFILNFNLVTL